MEATQNRPQPKWARHRGNGAHFVSATSRSREERKIRCRHDKKNQTCSTGRLCVFYNDLYYFLKSQRRSDVHRVPHHDRQVPYSLGRNENLMVQGVAKEGPRGPSGGSRGHPGGGPRRAPRPGGGQIHWKYLHFMDEAHFGRVPRSLCRRVIFENVT